MINTFRTRGLAAIALALAVIALPLIAADDTKSPVDSTKPAVSTGKETTLSGKIVDLHQYMTGESRSSYDKPTTSTQPDRTTTQPDRATQPGKTDDRNTAADKAHGKMMKNEIMGLETSSGLVLVCFKDTGSGIYATPRTDAPSSQPRTDLPRATDTPRTGDTATRADDSNTRWTDKQVTVSGQLFEKNGIKFLVVSKINNSDAPKTGTTPSTTPGTPGTPAPKTPSNP